MEEKTGIRPHRLMMHNRSALSVTGIRDVVSFDENQVILDTDMGLLTMKGKDLHVSRLTLEKGEIDIEGKIDSLTYSDMKPASRQGESFLGRLFK